MNRRSFLQASASSALFAAPRVLRADEQDLLPQTVIDAHTHFYDPRRPQGVPWPAKNDAVLYKTTLPADLKRVAPRVTGTVVVEASAWLEDNQWILDLAEREPLIVGFVGHLDPGTPGFADHVRRFSRHRLFRGIRCVRLSLAGPTS